MAEERQTLPLDPELQPLADQILKLVMVAVEKATAHAGDHKTFPLPVALGSLESVFLTRFKQLSVTQQQSATSRVNRELTLDVKQRHARLGELAAIDLKSVLPVAAQKDDIATRITLPPERLQQCAQVQDTASDAIEMDTTPAT